MFSASKFTVQILTSLPPPPSSSPTLGAAWTPPLSTSGNADLNLEPPPPPSELPGGSWPPPGSRGSSLAPATPGPPRFTENPVGGARGGAELPVWCCTDTWHSRLCPKVGEERSAELPSLDQLLVSAVGRRGPRHLPGPLPRVPR